MTARFLLASALALALSACGDSGERLNQTGANPELPEIKETLLPRMRIAPPVAWGDDLPSVPAGFSISAIATDLQVPRQTLVLPNGDILVAEGMGGYAPKLRPKDLIAGVIKGRGRTKVPSGNRITLLRDADGDGQYELRTVFIEGLNAPYGLAYVEGNIYVANQDAVMRFPYQDGQTRITDPGDEVTKLPAKVNHHWTKAMTSSADGSLLYVGIGSNSNAGERGTDIEEERAVIWEINRESGAHRTLVRGIRNPTALAIEPQTSILWSVVNERDEIGEELVPDYLTSVRDGAFYGWPYSYWGQHVDQRPRPQRPDLLETAIAPDYALGSHVAALGLSFAHGAAFPGYAEGAFVGQHGSWNRRDFAGYNVVWVPFSAGRPAGPPQEFVGGFLDDKGRARGRPVGVTYDGERRALLIADDLASTVWRVVATSAPAPVEAIGPAPTVPSDAPVR